ncbi:cysteine desulfurylase family member [Holotrichia oblita]|nr:cysteine desulfurylase family member [Holotrichia oblita]
MKVYLDNSATTFLDKNVLDKMMPYLTDVCGNANSLHSFGRDADSAVTKARIQVAEAINASKNEIFFTSGGTESDNWALNGVFEAHKDKGDHIIISKIEHAAILATAKKLEKEGARVTYLNVDKHGVVNLDELKKSVCDKTVLVSVMLANNEIGTIQPIKEVVKIVKSINKNTLVHTDAVQAVGSLPVDVKDLDVDLLSLSAHKIYGPKGVGALYLRTGVRLGKLITGGHQERSMRGGTTNVAGVVGLGVAIEEAVKNLSVNSLKIAKLRDYFAAKIKDGIKDVVFNGHPEKKLSSNLNVSFDGIEGESILQLLDINGIAVSTGSACSSGSLEPSHVLLATGLEIARAHGSIRFSFGKANTVEEADYAFLKLKETVDRLRDMSPIYKK